MAHGLQVSSAMTTLAIRLSLLTLAVSLFGSLGCASVQMPQRQANFTGTLIVRFVDGTDPLHKIQIHGECNINAADLSGVDPTDETTFTTGFPGTYLDASKKPSAVEMITLLRTPRLGDVSNKMNSYPRRSAYRLHRWRICVRVRIARGSPWYASLHRAAILFSYMCTVRRPGIRSLTDHKAYRNIIIINPDSSLFIKSR